MVEFFKQLGYLIRWGPCRQCFKRRRCAYRRAFTSGANKSAQVLIVTSWHLRREDLWTLKPLENRPLVVLDEDALSALAAPVELTVERLRSFIDNLDALRSAFGDVNDPAVAWLTRRLNKPLDGDQAALAMTDIFRRAAEDLLRGCATAGHGQWRSSEAVLDQIVTNYDQVLLGDNDVFFTLVRAAYDAARRRTALPNMLADLRELLTDARPVHLSVGACRWTRRSYLPPDRQVLTLDATAGPKVIEGLTGRPVEPIKTPLIEQQATIFQIMDKIGTRPGNRRDLARQESWTRKLATEVDVVTNEPLPTTLDVTGLYAAELFPAMVTSTRRSDFQNQVRQYANTMEDLAVEGAKPTNRVVCQKLGIRECNRFRYRRLVQQLPRPP